jgi:hypothetical protein
MTSSAHPDFDDFFDPDRLETSRKIREFGFVVQLIGYGECSMPGCDCSPEPDPWAYTVGCVELGHPEVVSLGCCLQHSHRLINSVIREFQAGRPVPIGDRSGTVVDGQLVALMPVPAEWVETDPARIASWWDHYEPGRPDITAPEIVQVVIADSDGLFPWDRPDGPPLLADDPLTYPRRPPRSARRAQARGRRQPPR